MTIEHDANGMPVAVSREYAARCELLRLLNLGEFGRGFETVYFREKNEFQKSCDSRKGWFVWTDKNYHTFFEADIGESEGSVRILEWRDHRGEGK